MSFMSGGGAECSTAGNPLSRMKTHMGDDKSLQRDRVGGPSNSAASFRSAAGPVSHDAAMNGFLNGASGMPLEAGMQLPHLRANTASPSWAAPAGAPNMEAAFKPPASTPAGFHPEEFARFSAARTQAGSPAAQMQAPQQAGPRPSMMGPYGTGMGMGMGSGYMMGQPAFSQMPMHGGLAMEQQRHQQQQQQQQTSGSSRVVELDDEKWQEHFDKIDLMDKEQQSKGKEKAPEQVGEMAEDVGEQNHGDFESIWRGIQDENATAEALRKLAVEEDGEFKVQGSIDDWNTFDESWHTGLGAWDTSSNLPHLDQYTFEPENIYEKHPSPFEEGMRIMREGGNLSLASLAFEAAVQNEPDHAEAWVQLGTAQAQNEKESAAIRALRKAAALEPRNLAALMGLAVSYTNEGYDAQALRALERWLNAKYPTILPDDRLSSAGGGELFRSGDADDATYDRVTDLFIGAARLSPDGEHMDPDVQVGLGVLFYSRERYDRAVDCFRAALASSAAGTSTQQEQVHLLWNRLGATLANSGRPEEAIGAYREALVLRPHFVRARYNLGVSCIAMDLHREAAGHLLAGLALHREIRSAARERVAELVTGGGGGGDGGDGDNGARVDEQLRRMVELNRSDTLVDTLRRVFTQMGRRDLAELCEIDVDPDRFRPEFDF